MAIPEPASNPDAMWTLNFKVWADAGSAIPLQAAQEIASHNSRMNKGMESVHLMWAERMASSDPIEAASIKQVLTGHSGGDNALVAALAQILTKAAVTTPPYTGGQVGAGGGG